MMISQVKPIVDIKSVADLANTAFLLEPGQVEACSVQIACSGRVATHIVGSHSAIEHRGGIGDSGSHYCCPECLDYDETHDYRE